MSKKAAPIETEKSSEIGDFIKSTLSSVFQAIDEVNYHDMSDGGLKIQIVSPFGGRPKPIGNKFTFEMPSSVSFDIAITASESSSVNGGIDLKIAKLGSDLAGGQSTVSRVNFDIPITKNFEND